MTVKKRGDVLVVLLLMSLLGFARTKKGTFYRVKKMKDISLKKRSFATVPLHLKRR